MADAELLAKLESLRKPHRYVEDNWYSCPKDPDGCSDDRVPAGECNCGADEHNAVVDEIKLRMIQFVGSEAPVSDIRWAVNVLLEKIAAKFEANETMDLWRSDAASIVRSFKHAP